MFKAKDREGHVVRAEIGLTYVSDGASYTCSGCDQPMEICCAAHEHFKKAPYFRHARDGRCREDYDERNSLSDWHRGWTAAAEYNEAETEVWRPREGKKERCADALVHGWCVEFQHSRIPWARVLARNLFWGRETEGIIWILDGKNTDDPSEIGEHTEEMP
jgi:hypothetical protein